MGQRKSRGEEGGGQNKAEAGPLGAAGASGCAGLQQRSAGPEQPGAWRAEKEIDTEGGRRNGCGGFGAGGDSFGRGFGGHFQRDGGEHRDAVVAQVNQRRVKQVAGADGRPAQRDAEQCGGTEAGDIEMEHPEQSPAEENPRPGRQHPEMMQDETAVDGFLTDGGGDCDDQEAQPERYGGDQAGDAGADFGGVLGQQKLHEDGNEQHRRIDAQPENHGARGGAQPRPRKRENRAQGFAQQLGPAERKGQQAEFGQQQAGHAERGLHRRGDEKQKDERDGAHAAGGQQGLRTREGGTGHRETSLMDAGRRAQEKPARQRVNTSGCNTGAESRTAGRRRWRQPGRRGRAPARRAPRRIPRRTAKRRARARPYAARGG